MPHYYNQKDHEHDCLVMDACINANDWLERSEAMRAKANIGLDEDEVSDDATDIDPNEQFYGIGGYEGGAQ